MQGLTPIFLMSLRDAVIIGAGPAGLACALEFQKNEEDAVVVEKDCLTSTVYRFPDQMRFFSTAAGLEIGDFRMHSESDQPTRAEAIRYYREVVGRAQLEIRQRETVLSIDGVPGNFHLRTSRATIRARRVVVATGYYGSPNLLGVPGESLPKVAHYYRDAHPYFGSDVMVVGGRNSAGIVAVELADVGARVTLVHRGDQFGMKPAIRAALESRIASKQIQVFMRSRVSAIHQFFVAVATPRGEREIVNDFVFAMTGYHPDFEFLTRNGIPLTPAGDRPIYNPATLESGRPGVYFAGAVMAGIYTHEIAIEASRQHGAKIMAGIHGQSKLDEMCGRAVPDRRPDAALG
jgi:thioredoxin reductase (NADPH)